MLSSDESKAGGKKERKARPPLEGDKARPRKRKGATQIPDVDQAQSAPQEESGVTVAPTAMAEAAPPPTDIASPLPSPEETSPAAPAVTEESAPVSYRTIVDIWGSYSRTSLEQTRSYFEKLAGVRSLGAAFEVQAEFAKQACETFVAQSQRIGELQGELTKQRLKRLEGLMEKTLGTRRS